MLDLKAAIDRLVELGRDALQREVKVHEVPRHMTPVLPRRYLYVPGTTSVTEVPNEKPPRPELLTVSTLAALALFVKENASNRSLMVHIEGPTLVSVVDQDLDDDWLDRAVHLHARCQPLVGDAGFRFGQYHDHEEFVVAVQSRFAQPYEGYDDRARVLGVVGNVKTESVRQDSDDGISQTVVARQGIAPQAVVVPNPVKLTPFRTFPEVTQPSSLFVLRAQPGKEGGKATFALFEADGGGWRVEAIKTIERYLSETLEVSVPILA